jgi:hypothetical protein
MRSVPVLLCGLLLAGCDGDTAFPAYAPDGCQRTIATISQEKPDDAKTGAMLGGICVMVEQQTREYLKAQASRRRITFTNPTTDRRFVLAGNLTDVGH